MVRKAETTIRIRATGLELLQTFSLSESLSDEYPPTEYCFQICGRASFQSFVDAYVETVNVVKTVCDAVKLRVGKE